MYCDAIGKISIKSTFAAASFAVAVLNMEINIVTKYCSPSDKSKVDKIFWNIHYEMEDSGPAKVFIVQAVYIPNGKTMPQ